MHNRVILYLLLCLWGITSPCVASHLLPTTALEEPQIHKPLNITGWIQEQEENKQLFSKCPAPKPQKQGTGECQLKITTGTQYYSGGVVSGSAPCKNKWYYHTDWKKDGQKAGWYNEEDYIQHIGIIIKYIGYLNDDISLKPQAYTLPSLEGMEQEVVAFLSLPNLDQNTFFQLLEEHYASIVKREINSIGTGRVQPFYIVEFFIPIPVTKMGKGIQYVRQFFRLNRFAKQTGLTFKGGKLTSSSGKVLAELSEDGTVAVKQALPVHTTAEVSAKVTLTPYQSNKAYQLVSNKSGEEILKVTTKSIPTAGKVTKGVRQFWTKSTTFKNIKVFQRNDLINPKLVDAAGRTNLQRMQKGLAPIGPDGKSLNLHHMTQTNSSGIAEMTQTFHKTNHRTIHINPNTIPSGINRSQFNSWKRSYWINRAKDF